jgi:C-terminal processing protease CtpA/Prc
LPDDVFQAIIQQELLFPLGVQIQNQRAYVTENASGNDEILAGAEILSMNGIPMPDILAEIKGYLPFSRIVQPHYFWYVFGSLEEYTLEVKLPGQESPVTHTVPGLDIMTIMQNLQSSEPAPAAPPEPVTYTRLPEDETIGLLRIDSFVGLGNSVKSAFAQIQQDGIQHLIIDVRANGGGMPDQVDLAMNFLTDQPYQHCSKSWKAPAGGYGSEATRRESACETQQPIEQPERYQGKRYLLVGPKTQSAAITFSTILQDYDLAVLLGEETLSPASFCARVSPFELPTLPRTGLEYRNSHTCFVRPSGETDWQRGVIPDFIVETSIEDMLSGHDPVLEYTLELIHSGE